MQWGGPEAAGSRDDQGLYRWRFDGFEFDEARFTLSESGKPVVLERKPLQVLTMLLRHAGEVVTKQELLDEVWAGRVTVEHVLATAIGKLRRAFGSVGEHRIITLPRVGYRFTGALERVSVGRQTPLSSLNLDVGQPVPGRSQFVLDRALDKTLNSEVWLAHHGKTRQARVFKFALDADRLYALKREVTVSRLLSDALPGSEHYIRLLDWNFAEEPYFVECEYGGPSLLDWALQEAGVASWSREQRLGLFNRIADAVAAAHGIGVLHKDIKPANVLIQPGPVDGWRVALTDFGSSRLLEPGRLADLGITSLGMTLTTAMETSGDVGTPLYLAPELVAGQPPTVQSDVYALGVLLYQFLVGDFRRPMAPGWERDIDDELLVRDIARATDGDPAQRYASVAELVSQLRQLEQRHSDHQRAAATAQSTAHLQRRLERMRERRPWLITTMATLLLACVSSAWLYWQADQARDQAEQESRRAAAILRFLSDDVIAQTNPERSDISHDPGLTVLLNQAMTGLQDRFADDPLLRAGVYASLADAFRALNNNDGALAAYTQAAEHYRHAVGNGDARTLRNQYLRAVILAWMNRYDDAQNLLDQSDSHAEELRRSNAETALLALVGRATWHGQQFQYAQALPLYESARELMLDATAIDESLRLFVDIMVSESRIRTGDPRGGEALLRQLLDDTGYSPSIRERRRGQLYAMLARSLIAQERLDEALVFSRDSVEDLERRLGPDNFQTITALSSLSRVHHLLKQCEPALQAGASAYERIRRTRGDEQQGTFIEQGNLGAKQFECGDRESGLANVAAAETGLTRLHGADNAAAQSFRFFRAEFLGELGQYQEALALLQNLSTEAMAASQARSGQAERVDALRGRLLLRAGDHQAAQALLEGVRDTLQDTASDPGTLEQVIGDLQLLAGTTGGP